MNHEAHGRPETIGPTANPGTGRIGLAIPTLNAGQHLDRLLPALQCQTSAPVRFLVIDSSSQDDTVARLQSAGAEIRTIAPESFDHGATRQMAVDILDDVEFVIFLTQDAIPAHSGAFANLVAPFRDSTVGMAYGRQLPAPDAGPLGAHARLFNYPERSHLRTIADAAHYGIKTVFCSNSFAAYRRAALMESGGFPERTIFGEDTLAAASLLRDGWRICYAAAAKVYHSHDYALVEEFRRYFDIGALHGAHKDLLGPFDRSSGEALRYLGSELTYLRRHAVPSIPLALLRNFLKYSGYRLGRVAGHLPTSLNRQLSMNPRFWSSRIEPLSRSRPKQTSAHDAQVAPSQRRSAAVRRALRTFAESGRDSSRPVSDCEQ